MPGDRLEGLSSEVTKLRVTDAKREEQLKSVDHRGRNNASMIQALEKRIDRIEGGIIWILRAGIGIAATLISIAYAWLRKAGFV